MRGAVHHTRDACVNIGPRQRRQRMLGGLIALIAAAALSVALARIGAPRLWRLALIVPLWAGWIGVLQARDGTCVALASRGVRHMNGTIEPVSDPDVRAQLVRRARGIVTRAGLIAAALTLAAWLVPMPR